MSGTSAINIFKRLSTLEINGGKSATRNWLEPVDLKVKGGIQVFKTLYAVGNIEVDQNLSVSGNLSADTIFAGYISSGLSAVNVAGNLCGNIIIQGNTVINELKTTNNLTTGSFEHYGWLGSSIHNSMQDTQISTRKNNTIVFKLNGTDRLVMNNVGGIQYGTGVASGVSSHASGSDTVSSGKFSHAEGISTTSSGYASHAENMGTTASGIYSHAEGITTTASGYASHAQGKNSVSSARSSHVEGLSNTVGGNVSHGEGFGNTVLSPFSYVEGTSNMSSSFNGVDHIEGRTNISSDNMNNESGLNHMEGESNNCTGYGCHLEGGFNVSSNKYTHVGGHSAKADQLCQWARASGKISTLGDAQTSMFHIRTEIMGATTGQLDMNYPISPEIFPKVDNGECCMFEVHLVGRDETSTDYFAQKIEALAVNISGVVTIQSNVLHTFQTGTLMGASSNITAQESNIVVSVTSSSSDITRWAGTLIVTHVN
jgi:hypothetical protein